jgi:ribosome biogenesis GTPase
MNPEFHPRFIDRYLAVLQDGNVSPVICLNKADLTPERHPILTFYRRLDIPFVETSLKTGQGIEELKSLLRGKTSVLVGQSGVGKSSLVNAIAPHVQAEIGAVTEKRGTGMHTTTRSNLYQWEEKSFLIDTPGIRSLGMENVPREEIRFLFPEFARLPHPCKFADCLHLKEPGCAVKHALETNMELIHAARYESYQRMMEEA